MSSYYEALDTMGKKQYKEKLEAVVLLISNYTSNWPSNLRSFALTCPNSRGLSMDTYLPTLSIHSTFSQTRDYFQSSHVRTVLCMTLSLEMQGVFC